MSRAYTRSIAAATSCVVALSTGGCDSNSLSFYQPPPLATAVTPEARAPAPETVDTVAPAPDRAIIEGAATAPLVFARAQAAVLRSDYFELLASIRPETRNRWLRDMLVALAVESVEEHVDPDLAKRRARAEVRRILATFGATAAIRSSDDASAGALGEQLMAKVKDPDGLFVALLLFADDEGAPYDPVRALESPQKPILEPEDGGPEPLPLPITHDADHPWSERGAAPSAVTTGLARLVARVRWPNQIGDVDVDAGVAMTIPSDAGPPAHAGFDGRTPFLPVRFYTRAGTTWLDES